MKADLGAIDVDVSGEPDPHIEPLGITSVAAALANPIYHGCGMRVRDLPITLDKRLV